MKIEGNFSTLGASPGRSKRGEQHQAFEDLGTDVLLFILGDEDRLSRFLLATGLDPSMLRTAIKDPGLVGGALDFLTSDDALILTFAAERGRRPEQVVTAIQRVRG